MPRRLGKRQNSSSLVKIRSVSKQTLAVAIGGKNTSEELWWLPWKYMGYIFNMFSTPAQPLFSNCSSSPTPNSPQHKFYQDQWDLATLMEWFNAHWTPPWTHLASYSDYRTPQWIRTSLQQKQGSRVSSWILPVFLLFQEAHVCSKSSFSSYLCLNSLELGDVLGQV